MKNKLIIGFLVYGVIAGLLSSWWWHISDNIFYLNIPGDMLGQLIYEQSITVFGESTSPQAHYTIPWILRIPQVYVPASVLLWGLFGWIIQLVYNVARRKAK